jgi:hypothetical protein
MHILISGASGLIGRELTRSLPQQGHQVSTLRRGAGQSAPFWDIDREIIELGQQHFDAVINLAGENIAVGRWTAARKERIMRSRVDSTRLLTSFFAAAAHKPRVIISASAVGIYGDRGDELLTESSSSGAGFLAKVGQAWEEAAADAAAAGIRVVNARFGIVLSREGGALARMLPPFRLGLGGILGSGRQWMSWISIHELPGIIEHLLHHEELSGPVNLTVPHPVTNRQFTKLLSRVLRRPAFVPVPSLLLKFFFGEMAAELLLASARVQPDRLLESGYVFRTPELETALRNILS